MLEGGVEPETFVSACRLGESRWWTSGSSVPRPPLLSSSALMWNRFRSAGPDAPLIVAGAEGKGGPRPANENVRSQARELRDTGISLIDIAA